MWFKGFLLLAVSISLFLTVASLNHSNFPAKFVFGSASSAYQIEGAVSDDGRGPSIWDTFTHKYPDRIAGRNNGDIAIDSYHRYKEDIDMMKDIGFQAYRFSISWSRILPRGNLKGGINQEGITYYNNLINKLLSNGLQPFVTLFHWDLPQALEDEYGGFLSRNIVQDFANYAELCFREFGDRVKHWITLNEPQTYSLQGYGSGLFPPLRCSKYVSPICSAGDSSTEPYLVTHHQILAHAAAVKVFREKYQISQKGEIGIALGAPWFVPLSQSKADIDTTHRAIAFLYDWFMEPLYSGSYPTVMVNIVGKRLPKFSPMQYLMVKGSYDFIGLNYYTASYAANTPCQQGNVTVLTDLCARFSFTRNGVPIGPKAASDWLYVYPQGIQEFLEYNKNKFNNPTIYIAENGVDEVNDGTISLDDKFRIYYISQHLLYIQRAVWNGVKVKGYFHWSFSDTFEWTAGYSLRFGMVYVDFKNGLKRYNKRSALWFKTFLHQ